MTEAQAVQLDVLEAAVQNDFQEQQSKSALAEQKAQEAATAAGTSVLAEREADAARLKLAEDIKKLKAFVDQLANPAVGIDVIPGTPTERD